MSKKILIFSLAYYPKFVGGAEVAIKEITDRIDSKDIEFDMVSLRFDKKSPKVEKIGNVTIHRIGFTTNDPSMTDLRKFPLHLNKLLFQFTAAWKAHKLHKKNNYDAIWGMMAHSTAVPAGLFKTFHPRVPYLLTLQEGDPPEYIERLARPVWPLFKRGFTRADAFQPISTFLLDWGKRMGFVGYAEIIPNGVDTTRFKQASKEDITLAKAALGKKNNDVYLVTTSRLVKKNAVDDVIHALKLLPKEVSFLIYGTGSDEESLRTLATTCGVDERTRFLGYIDHTHLPHALSACDIFIRPSRSEGMGNSFIEAMAAGLPVIATQEGGIADFLFDAKRNPNKETTGWAVDKDSPEQIATAVQYILSHPEQVAHVMETAKRLAFEHYNWDDIALRMNKLFKRLFVA